MQITFFKQATPPTQESKDEILHLSALRIQVTGAAEELCSLLQLQLQHCRRFCLEFKAGPSRKSKTKSKKGGEMTEMAKSNIVPASMKARIATAMERFLNWMCVHYKIIVDALDEGERIHQLVEERKEEERLKTIRNGILYRFY